MGGCGGEEKGWSDGDGDDATDTSSRHRALQTGQTLPDMQRRWNVWLHSDVTVAWPRPMATWQTGHDGVCVAGGAESGVAGACCPNRLLPTDSDDDGDAVCAPAKLKEEF